MSCESNRLEYKFQCPFATEHVMKRLSELGFEGVRRIKSGMFDVMAVYEVKDVRRDDVNTMLRNQLFPHVTHMDSRYLVRIPLINLYV